MKDKISKWFLIILGSLSWSLTMVKSGWLYSFGMGFWGANGHDGIWHIALAESLSRGSSGMPVFSGSILQNYHIGFDLLVAVIHTITKIPIVNLYFQILPPILAVLVGFFVYQFTFNWTKSGHGAWWSTFFVYFGGGFGFLIGKGESAFWSQQAISTLINPPFALSLIVLLTGLILLQKIEKKFSFRIFVFAVLCFGVLIEIKAYAGILSLGALFLISILQYIRKERFEYFYIFLGSLITAILLYLPLNNNSQGLLIWQPFWFLETMVGLGDRVGWQRFYSAMMTYKSGHIWFKAIPSYTIALVIFYIGNLGTRIIKELFVWKWFKNLKQIGTMEVFSSSVIIAGLIIPMLFLQKGTPWNTIQFFYYSLFFSAILAGIAVGQFVKNSRFNTSIIYIIEVGIILLTIPTTVITLKDVYIPSRPPAMLTKGELSALSFLSKQNEGIILTYPFDPQASILAESNPPRPLYLYVSNAYVSAFSKHQTFLEDEVNLDITGYDWQARRKMVEDWYKETNQNKARAFLRDNNIKYVYWVKPQKAILNSTSLGLKNVFENNEAVVYQVD